MSTSDDFGLQYDSKDGRGDLCHVVNRVTSEVITIFPTPYEEAMGCKMMCGERWSEAEMDRLTRRRMVALEILNLPKMASLTTEPPQYGLFAEHGENGRPNGLYSVRRMPPSENAGVVVANGLTYDEAATYCGASK